MTVLGLFGGAVYARWKGVGLTGAIVLGAVLLMFVSQAEVNESSARFSAEWGIATSLTLPLVLLIAGLGIVRRVRP